MKATFKDFDGIVTPIKVERQLFGDIEVVVLNTRRETLISEHYTARYEIHGQSDWDRETGWWTIDGDMEWPAPNKKEMIASLMYSESVHPRVTNGDSWIDEEFNVMTNFLLGNSNYGVSITR